MPRLASPSKPDRPVHPSPRHSFHVSLWLLRWMGETRFTVGGIRELIKQSSYPARVSYLPHSPSISASSPPANGSVHPAATAAAAVSSTLSGAGGGSMSQHLLPVGGSSSSSQASESGRRGSNAPGGGLGAHGSMGAGGLHTVATSSFPAGILRPGYVGPLGAEQVRRLDKQQRHNGPHLQLVSLKLSHIEFTLNTSESCAACACV